MKQLYLKLNPKRNKKIASGRKIFHKLGLLLEEQIKQNRDHIFTRRIFADEPGNRQNMLTNREMRIDGRNNDLLQLLADKFAN